jgi:hypothetical protein
MLLRTKFYTIIIKTYQVDHCMFQMGIRGTQQYYYHHWLCCRYQMGIVGMHFYCFDQPYHYMFQEDKGFAVKTQVLIKSIFYYIIGSPLLLLSPGFHNMQRLFQGIHEGYFQHLNLTDSDHCGSHFTCNLPQAYKTICS